MQDKSSKGNTISCSARQSHYNISIAEINMGSHQHGAVSRGASPIFHKLERDSCLIFFWLGDQILISIRLSLSNIDTDVPKNNSVEKILKLPISGALHEHWPIMGWDFGHWPIKYEPVLCLMKIEKKFSDFMDFEAKYLHLSYGSD